jgi:hypothetical protein
MKVPYGHWSVRNNCISFLETIAKKEGLSTDVNDVTSLNYQTILKHGGLSLLKKYDSSVLKMMTNLFPETLFQRKKNLLEEIGTKLRIKRLEDWYKISSTRILNQMKQITKDLYWDDSTSTENIVRGVYPTHEWGSDRFLKPKIFWRDISNQKIFLDGVIRNFGGIHRVSDWRKLTFELVRKSGGGPILSIYGQSVFRMLQRIYPQVDFNFRKRKPRLRGQTKSTFQKWMTDLTGRRSAGARFWEDPGNVEKFVKFLGKELEISQLEDWYRVSLMQIKKVTPVTLFKLKNLGQVLKETFPEHSWEDEKFNLKKSAQRILSLRLGSIFPSDKKFEEFSLPNVRYRSGGKISLDIYFPALSLAFEYQGEHHYYDTFHIGPKWSHYRKDVEKKKICLNMGITLIEIPFWWDQNEISLKSTVNFYRKDLFPEHAGVPIPKTPPDGHVKRTDIQW